MQESKSKFTGVVDHIAIKSVDVTADAREYERLGFHVESEYSDWAMLRDAHGFGVALLGPGSKHPPHLGVRVETREALELAAAREGRVLREHRDRSVSFYTKGPGQAVEVIYYPPDFGAASGGEASEEPALGKR